jgi:uncharacterized protein YbjQ (UPF0145 family)
MSEQGVCITSTDTIAGQGIVATLGFVFGLAVRTRGLGGNITAGLRTLGGNSGALLEYAHDLSETRREAIEHLITQARDLGANAVVGLRFDAAEVGYEMSEIVAYGTAVVIAPLPSD